MRKYNLPMDKLENYAFDLPSAHSLAFQDWDEKN
jgi:hypothetical protein